MKETQLPFQNVQPGIGTDHFHWFEYSHDVTPLQNRLDNLFFMHAQSKKLWGAAQIQMSYKYFKKIYNFLLKILHD